MENTLSLIYCSLSGFRLSVRLAGIETWKEMEDFSYRRKQRCISVHLALIIYPSYLGSRRQTRE